LRSFPASPQRGVVAIGKISYDEQTDMEDKYFRLQLNLVRDLDPPVMIHTPHRDKKRGASRSMDVILEHKLDPSRVDICTWSPDDNEGSTKKALTEVSALCGSISATSLRLRRTLGGLSIPHAASLLAVGLVLCGRHISCEGRTSEGECQSQRER
jgi:hypothetical protein